MDKVKFISSKIIEKKLKLEFFVIFLKKDLIFFIESRSRQLSAKTAETKELLEKKRNKRLFDEAQKTKEENNQLFFSIMESQGLMGSKNTSECVGCGIVVAVNAQCKC